MPELPEVESIRRQLEPLLCGRHVIRCDSHPSVKFLPAREIIGMGFESVNRRGKYLLFGLDDGNEMVIHLGMTGQLLPVSDLSDPHLRAWWEFDNELILGYRDIRRFGRIRICKPNQYDGTLKTMGPEPLSDDFTVEQFHSTLKKSSRKIKTQLLSQRPVAGVGNIYADEACFRAGIYPGVRRLTKAQARDLHESIRYVLSIAVENGGTTLRDYVNVEGKEGTNQHFLTCYGRWDQPCLNCGEPLRRTVIDNRGTTFCGNCQRR
ncbi:MAG: DNA-formamidopyrimidine glycosylase [Acidimicrobiaceae bacterium]|nr:DNA-formamidopyrimidine glycosylase [Acidimicrobiaceae bacterium]|tara:strand:+ start:3111 stop:3902 length:792 start_codon:yes stop_codon:yes gene_type:complete